MDQHLADLHKVLRRLSAAGLCFNQKKCVLAASKVKYLGHVVDSSGIIPLPAKVDVVVSMLRPTNKVELQRFLGCVNFFHRFLPGIASILAPLHALTGSVSTQKYLLLWTTPQNDAFAAAKFALCHLCHPPGCCGRARVGICPATFPGRDGGLFCRGRVPKERSTSSMVSSPRQLRPSV